MDGFLFVLSLCVLALASVPMWFVVLQCLAASTYGFPIMERVAQRDLVPRARHPSAVVLVPAHDEESSIGETLDSLFVDLPPRCSVLVVAHNCSDGTGRVARSLGAAVLETGAYAGEGKPGALRAALEYLDRVPDLDVVVVVDADCTVRPGSVRALVDSAYGLQRPVMGLYRFAQAASEAGRHSYMSMIALILKNVVRPLGLHVLGMPCLLNGSGSAYPRHLLRRIRIGGGSIAEDYDMSIELARLGHAPVLEPRARILSRLPGSDADGLRQRRRWEHGHLQLAVASAPRLLLESIFTGSRELAKLALELCVPPLAVLLALGALAVGVCGLHWLVSGEPALLVVAGVTVITFLSILLLTVVRFTTMRDGWRAARSFPAYFLAKLPLYRDFLVRRETRWLRSARG